MKYTKKNQLFVLILVGVLVLITLIAQARGIAVNSESHLIGSIANRLVLVDGATGRATDLGTVGDFDQIESTTSVNGTLYGIVHTTSSPKVIRIDPLSMQATHLVTITVPGETITSAEAMAFCPEDGLLYVAAGEYAYSDILITIHPATGDITELADIAPAVSGNPADADALEWVEGTLYAVDVDANPSYLYTIDPSSGDTTSIGTIGVNYVSSLAYDPTTQTLYAISEPGRQLISISLPDGQGTPIGDTHIASQFDGATMRSLTAVPTLIRHQLYLPLVSR